jgi:hypothetical protein
MQMLRHYFYIAGITVLIALNASLARAQSKETVVTYDIDKREFETVLPFDETFKIKFKSTKPIALIQVKYKVDQSNPINNDFKKKYYFQKNADNNGYVGPAIRNVSATAFEIGGIGPLHPNTPYVFEFYIYEKINATDEVKNALKADVQKYLNQLYVDTDVLPDPAAIEANFATYLQKYQQGLYDSNGNALTISTLFSTELATYKAGLSTAKNAIDRAITNFDSNALKIDNAFFGTTFCKLVEKLVPAKVTNPGLLDEPVDLLIDGHSSITLKKMIEFYKYNCNRDFTYTNSIFEGKAKFNADLGLQLLPKGQKYNNIESLQLVKSSVVLMKNLKTSNAKYFNPFSNQLIGCLSQKIDEAKIIAENRSKLSELNAAVPDILADKYSQKAVRNDYQAITDVETAATPYINLDLGLMYATGLNDVFALQTVNFHLSPVNRRALFSNLEGWDKFFKQACFQIGLAQRLGPSDERFDTFLTGDLGTPFIGVGFRVNRIFRVSAGMMVYQEKNINPIITDKETKGSFAFTITINSALSQALGVVGSVFKGIDK